LTTDLKVGTPSLESASYQIKTNNYEQNYHRRINVTTRQPN